MKNKTTFFLIAVLVSTLVTISTMGQSRFSIAPTISPSYQHLNWAAQFENAGALKGSQSNQGVSVGLTAAYAFTSKWSLSAGLLYNRSSGSTQFDNAINKTSESYRYENWQLPLLVNYASSIHRLSPYFSAGLLANHNYRITNTTTMVSSYHKLDEGTVSAFTLYGMVGMGMQYRVKPNLVLIVQPTAAYRINAPSEGNPITYTHYNDYLFGLQTQLKFSF